MFAQKVTLVVLMHVLGLVGLAGCGLVPTQPVDYKKAVLAQPVLTAELQKEVSSKKLSAFTIWVGGITCYDTSDLPLVFKRIGNRPLNIVEDLPILSDPPSEAARNASIFLSSAKEDFQKNGSKVTDRSCDGCVEVRIDFAPYRRNASTLVIMAKYSAFFRGKPVAIGKEYGRAWSEGAITLPGKGLQDALARLAEDARQALNAAWDKQAGIP